jgi:hypothetical protein
MLSAFGVFEGTDQGYEFTGVWGGILNAISVRLWLRFSTELAFLTLYGRQYIQLLLLSLSPNI